MVSSSFLAASVPFGTVPVYHGTVGVSTPGFTNDSGRLARHRTDHGRLGACRTPSVSRARGPATLRTMAEGISVEDLIRRGPLLSARYAVIGTRDGASLQLTGADLLWAGRMVLGEGGSKEADLWSMTSRAMVRAWRGQSFTTVVRNFAQPINPKWFPDGVCCAEGAVGCPARPDRSFYCGDACQPEDPCSPRAFDRRRRISETPWTSLPEPIRRAVSLWAVARTPNPAPGAIDWGSAALVSSQLTRGTLERRGQKIVLKAGNWYLDSPESRAWPRDFVTMSFEGRTVASASDGLLLPLVLLGASVGATSWIFYRTMRGNLGVLPRYTPRCDRPMSVHAAQEAWVQQGQMVRDLLTTASDKLRMEFNFRKKIVEIRAAFTGVTTGSQGRTTKMHPQAARFVRDLARGADALHREQMEIRKDLRELQNLRVQCLQIVERGERGPSFRRRR
jgi:hypothetical protein